MYCGDGALVNNQGKVGTAVPLYCRRWTCPECAPKRKRQLKTLARSGQPTTFITLTASPGAGETPSEAAQTLVRSWRRIRRELSERKKLPASPFIAVFERTKKGRPHLHILARLPWISQKWLSARMAHLAQSPIVDIRKVHNQRQAAAYVSKYLAKDPTIFLGCKRYWRSQDWQLDKEDDETPLMDKAQSWIPDRRSLPELQNDLRRQGYVVWIESDGIGFCWPWPTAPPYEVERFARTP